MYVAKLNAKTKTHNEIFIKYKLSQRKEVHLHLKKDKDTARERKMIVFI
jgi:hypothetical protein